MKAVKIVLGLSALNFIALLIATFFLPDIVPTHVNAINIIDGHGSKWTILLTGLLPAIMPICILFYWRLMGATTKAQQNRNVIQAATVAVSVFMLILSWFSVVLTQFDTPYNNRKQIGIVVMLFILLPMGVMFVILGVFMPKIQPNTWLGIRTPWTLADEDVWRKTHKVGGVCMIASGVLMPIIAFLPKVASQSIFAVLLIIPIMLIPVAYSAVVFIKAHR